MPNATTIAPDGATISIPSTGTPLDQIHLAAALDHYTSNYLGSLDITHSPDFTQNSDRMAAPTMPSPALTASRPAPVVPATRATAPLQSTASAQNTASAQSAAPLRAQSKTPRRHAVSQQATFLNPLVNNDPGDTIGRFSDATEAAQRAYTAAPTSQNEQALRTAYANELTNLDRTGATRRTPQLKQYADRVRASGWDKPLQPSAPSASPSVTAKPRGPLVPFQSSDTRLRAIIDDYTRKYNADKVHTLADVGQVKDALTQYLSEQGPGFLTTLEGKRRVADSVNKGWLTPEEIKAAVAPRTPLQDIGHAIGVDIFGTGSHRGAFGRLYNNFTAPYTDALDPDKLTAKMNALDAQVDPSITDPQARSLASLGPLMKGVAKDDVKAFIPANTSGVLRAGSQLLTGHPAQAKQTFLGVGPQVRDSFDLSKGGDPVGAFFSWSPEVAGILGIAGKAGRTARVAELGGVADGNLLGRGDLDIGSALRQTMPASGPQLAGADPATHTLASSLIDPSQREAMGLHPLDLSHPSDLSDIPASQARPPTSAGGTGSIPPSGGNTPESSYRPARGALPSYVVISPEAIKRFRQYLNGSDGASSNGFTLRKVHVHDLEKAGPNVISPETLGYLQQSLKDNKGHGVIVVNAHMEHTFASLRETLLHEPQHVLQFKYPLSEDAQNALIDSFKADPKLKAQWERFSEEMELAGYSEKDDLRELPAMIAGGTHQYLLADDEPMLSDEAAEEMFARYVHAVQQEHPNTTAAAEMYHASPPLHRALRRKAGKPPGYELAGFTQKGKPKFLKSGSPKPKPIASPLANP